MKFWRKRKSWRINLSHAQLSEHGCAGADEYRYRHLQTGQEDLWISEEAGDRLDGKDLDWNDEFLLTAVANLGAGDTAATSHLAIAKGVIRSFQFNRAKGGATIKFKGFVLLDSPARERAMQKPGKHGNVHELDASDRKRFF